MDKSKERLEAIPELMKKLESSLFLTLLPSERKNECLYDIASTIIDSGYVRKRKLINAKEKEKFSGMDK